MLCNDGGGGVIVFLINFPVTGVTSNIFEAFQHFCFVIFCTNFVFFVVWFLFYKETGYTGHILNLKCSVTL